MRKVRHRSQFRRQGMPLRLIRDRLLEAPRCARQLSKPGQAPLGLIRCKQHHICQLIDNDDDIGQLRGAQFLNGNGRARHLHERENALLHPRAARGGDDDDRNRDHEDIGRIDGGQVHVDEAKRRKLLEELAAAIAKRFAFRLETPARFTEDNTIDAGYVTATSATLNGNLAVMGTAANGNTSSGTTAEDHGINHIVSGPRAIDGFRGREAVGIILHANFALEGVTHVLLDGLAKDPG